MEFVAPTVNAAAPSTSATRYRGLFSHGAGWGTSEPSVRQPIAGTGTMTLEDAVPTLSGTPGAGKSYALTLMENGGATAVTTTISDSETTDTFAGLPFTLTEGAEYSWRCVPSGTPTSRDIRIAIKLKSTNAIGSVMAGDTAAYAGAGSVTYIAPMGLSAHGAAAADGYALCPGDGAASRLFVEVGTAPGGTDTVTVALYVNGSATGLSVTITGTATTGSDTATSPINLAPGDLVCFRVTTSATAAGARLKLGWMWTPDADGEYPWMLRTTGVSTAVAEFAQVAGSTAATTTPAVQSSLATTLTRVYADLVAAPGVGKSYVIAADIAGSGSGTATVTVADAATTASVTGLSTSVASGHTIYARLTPSGTPTDPSVARIGFMSYIAPAGAVVTNWRLPLLGVG